MLNENYVLGYAKQIADGLFYFSYHQEWISVENKDGGENFRSMNEILNQYAKIESTASDH